MKKLLTILFTVLILVGCNLTMDKPSDAIEKYLNNYRNLNKEVLNDLDDTIDKEDLSENNKELYKEALKRQFRNLSYEIKDEEYNGNNAKVTVKITVYDYYAANKVSAEYLEDNRNEFLKEDGTLNNDKYNEYRIKKLNETDKTISYSITFDVTKKDDVWKLEQPNIIDLEKIQGIYNYEM